MNFWIGIIISLVLLLATFLLLATKFTYPYHRRVGFGVFLLAWIPFLYSLSLRRQWLLEQQEIVVSFFTIYWIHFLFGGILLLAFYVLNLLFPASKSNFDKLSKEDLDKTINEDRKIIFYLDEKLNLELNKIKHQKIFSRKFINIGRKERESIKFFWSSFVESLRELDVLKEKYKSFYLIDNGKEYLSDKAFDNGFAAFLAQHCFMINLVKNATNENLIVILNEESSSRNIPADTYDRLKAKISDTTELLRLNAGRAYFSFSEDEDVDIKNIINKYLLVIDNSIATYSKIIIKRPLRFFEKKSYKLWFPLQKSVAKNISYIRASKRPYLINPRLIKQNKKKFLPGDIFLERREWHATNIGIPGFWTHSAMYLGTLKYLNYYFLGLEALKGKSLEEFLKKHYPQVFIEFNQKDKNGHKPAVIEVKRPGVIFTSIEDSMSADSFVVLRVKDLSKEGRFQVFLQAIENFGKPYDFDFNFVTENTLVCTELIYRAYQGINKLNFELSGFNGRLFISPNQIAEKYTKEYQKKEQELDLILFLDGNERKRVAKKRGEKEFLDTWQRPKWHVVKDYLKF